MPAEFLSPGSRAFRSRGDAALVLRTEEQRERVPAPAGDGKDEDRTRDDRRPTTTMRTTSTATMTATTTSREPLRVDLSVNDGRLRARIAGELRVETVGDLDRILLRITAERPTTVVLDLSRVDSVPCLAIGSLAAFYRGICRRGGTVQVIAPNGRGREAIERTWLRAALAG